MIRVVRTGGVIVFDVVTEKCLAQDHLAQWIASGIQSGPYPAIMPEQYVIELFSQRGCTTVFVWSCHE